MSFNDLSRYAVVDAEKRRIIDDILNPKRHLMMAKLCAPVIDRDLISELNAEVLPETKFCPKCRKRYPEEENFCFDCAVRLRPIRDVDVKDIEIAPSFNPRKPNRFESFEDIFSRDNIERIEEFDFTMDDFKKIIKRIKTSSLRRLDKAVKENDILLDRLDILDRVLLFAKSFVNVGYKSFGAELGYFEFNRIIVDDRQLSALQITTILHELSHFLMKEFTAQILCELLDCKKTAQIESVAVFILSYTPVNKLIDEYCAHTVEGRFTLFGYQDYSSYLSIEKTIDMPAEEIEMIKTIGNSFSVYIKQILESFIDYDMREDIKKQFKCDILDDPDYNNLKMENCQLLYDEGMLQAIGMVIQEGFMISMDNIETLEKYSENWK